MVRWCAVAWALLWGIWLPGGAIAAGTMGDCFADLERGTSDYIVCAFPLNPSPNERAELEKQTSGYLKDVVCTVAIRVERAMVKAAITTPEYLFEAPPQPVACNVTVPGKSGPTPTPDEIVPITATFAPRVTIRDGIAIQATPGLGDVKGVSRIISLPVVAYVNRAQFLRDGMLKIVNAWMAHMRGVRTKAG